MPDPSHKKVVLIVDDDFFIVEQFKRAFKNQEDAFLDIASTPDHAIKKIQEYQYDLVCLDMKLGQDRHAGMEVLREIHRLKIEADARQQAIKPSRVVIMSGSINHHEIMREAHNLRVFCFIDKPMPFTKEFVREVINWFGIPLMPEKTNPPINEGAD